MSKLADSKSFFAARTKRLAETGNIEYRGAVADGNKPAVLNGKQIDSTFEQDAAKIGQKQDATPTIKQEQDHENSAGKGQEYWTTPTEAQPGKDAVARETMTRLSQAFVAEAAMKQDQGVDISEPKVADKPMQMQSHETSRTFENSGFFNVNDVLPTGKVSSWKPLAVRNMPPLPEQKLANKPVEADKMERFTKEFLVDALGGKVFSPGFFSSPGHRSLPSETYFILDAEIEPYLPQIPGEHGAKLSVLFRDFDDDKHEKHYHNVPLFVSCGTNQAGEKVYGYFGTYSQMRWSDKLSYDEVVERVPTAPKKFWAAILSNHERPEWLTDKLVRHFVPKPEYIGALPESNDIVFERHAGDVKDYLEQLRDWTDDRDDFLMELTEAKIMEAFEKAEADYPPGLRFYWEYLQCVSFDRPFYQTLVTQFRGKQ